MSDDSIYVHMGGGCQGCGMASVTLKHGIEAMVQESFPEITNIIDTTDHASGTNPYYQPAKG
jgi:Fe/S biogenesis protein NfuA